MYADVSPFTISGLRQAYLDRSTTPSEVIATIYSRLASEPGQEAWIYLRPAADVIAEADAATAAMRKHADWPHLPLLGIPFAVKDNIDVAGLPTTAACPAFAYTAGEHAAVVEQLIKAGAILIGKTNLDQFATGLVGTRSPYGAVGNPFNPAYMSGGSSSGSAAVVARGWAAFALGTDTAGSGRIPAGACDLVGIKPTPGLVSCWGVVPACRSLDCVSVFAHTVEDGWTVLSAIAGPDPRDPFSHDIEQLAPLTRSWRIGIPATPTFFGDTLARQAWQSALDSLRNLPGLSFRAMDLQPFLQVAQLLYEGPWVAERRVAIDAFMQQHAAEMDPTVCQIIGRADGISAADGFRGLYQLERLRRVCTREMEGLDLLLVPTAPTIYRHAEIAAEPILTNSRLGHYTNFVNLLGMAAVALPGPFRRDGLPAGVTLIGPAGSDHRLAAFGRQLQRSLQRRPVAQDSELPPLADQGPHLDLAVVGAHLRDMPLNWQLTERGAVFLEATHTAAEYRLYALPATHPPKPALIRVTQDGVAIAVEVWRMPLRHFGSLVAEIPAPLGIGSIRLADGREVKGFLGEAAALDGAEDISRHGGWRAWQSSVGAAIVRPYGQGVGTSMQ